MMCLAGDVILHVPPQNPSLPANAFADGLWSAQNKVALPALGEGRVLISPGAEQRLLFSTATNAMEDFIGKRLALWSNLNLLERAPKVNGSSTLQLREQAQVQGLLYGGSNRLERGLIEMLGVKWFSPAENPTLWLPLTNACALVSCGQGPVFAEPAQTLQRLASPDFNPRQQVFLPPASRRFVSVSNTTLAQVHSVRFGSHAIVATVEAQEPSLVVVAQSWCRSWRARVDEAEVPVFRANHAFQALEVPAGRHEIRLEYRDRQFVLGGVTSILTLAGCGWYWFRGGRQSVAESLPTLEQEEVLTPAEV